MLAAALLAGCGSRSGTTGGGGSQQDRVSQHVTSVMLARAWIQVIYPPTPTPSSPTCTYDQQPIMIDGKTGVKVRDRTCLEWTEITLDSGCTELKYQFPPLPSGAPGPSGKSTICRTGNKVHADLMNSNGDTVRYDKELDLGANRTSVFDNTTTWNGEIRFGQLQTREAARFMLVQANRTRLNTLTMTFPDGARLTLRLPFQFGVDFAVDPDYRRPIEGTFKSNGQDLAFTVASVAGQNWNEWTLTAPGGIRGTFTLNEDFSGHGQFYDRGQIDASISWDQKGDASVTLVSGAATTAGPSAAARDLIGQIWRALFAESFPRS